MLVNIKNLPQITNDGPPENLIAWLNNQSSLSNKLKSITGDATLEVLHESWRKPNSWEEDILGLYNEPLFAREILILSHEQACWYGRTIVPYATYHAHKTLFARLDTEPLGKLIYGNSEVKRLMLFNYAINKECLEYYWLPKYLQKSDETFWLRFSIFSLNELFFCLNEILLPELKGLKTCVG